MAIDAEIINTRPNTVEFAYGRAFFALNSTVYFSQVMEQQNLSFLANCFQRNDPTSGEISDLVPTDGGVVPIDDASNIISIKSFFKGILILASNGVWLLRGGEAGFTATDQTLTRLSSVGCVYQKSVVRAEGNVYFWAREGIMVAMVNEQGQPVINNLTEGTVDEYYKDLLETPVQRVTSNYDPSEKELEWFFSYSPTSSLEGKDRGLVFNLKTQGFYPMEFNRVDKNDVSQYFLVGKASSYSSQTGNKKVVLSGRHTTRISDGSDVAILGVGSETDEFEEYGSSIPTAYFETFNESLGSPSNSKRISDMSTMMVQTEQNWVDDGEGGLELDKPSSCLMTSKWDWNDTSANGRFSDQQEIYRRRRLLIPSGAGEFDSGEEYLVYKPRVRGRGKAVRFKFEQQANKDMKILGWTITWSMKPRQ